MKIVIWIGPAWETWGPENLLKGGIGGSETAAINVARELSRWGHEVRVIGRVTPCRYEGVSFEDHLAYIDVYSPRIECDVFISSRSLQALRLLRPKCRLSVLWMHDVHVGDDWQGDMQRYDMIFCLSDWSRKLLFNYYPDVPKDRFVVTRNGIDPNLFMREPVREGCRAIYSSSPDRGLDRLLDYWPKVREIRPDAELDVYYGFDTWTKMAEHNKNKAMEMTIALFKERLASMEEQGVHLHGRVGQGDLAKAFLRSSMWIYPTSFKETSCISAMEAQAAGLYIVTSRLAALIETVKFGCLVNPPNTRDGYEEEFMGHVRNFLDRPGGEFGYPVLRSEAREWALRHLSWAEVAGRWEEMFAEKIASKEKT
jgi:glycosyltransferase involved in cell wall biosynthesis